GGHRTVDQGLAFSENLALAFERQIPRQVVRPGGDFHPPYATMCARMDEVFNAKAAKAAKTIRLCVLCVLCGLVFPRDARAHPVPFSYLDLRIQPDAIDGSLVVHMFDAAHDLQVDPPERLLDARFAAD